MRIAVLALQGAFIEHEQVLQRLGVETFELRQLKDWQQPKDGLILPGGESTVQMRLLNELGLFVPIREAILDGMPVFGTCAGMILLSEGRLGTMHIQVRRNAYGRQLGSFHTTGGKYLYERGLTDKTEIRLLTLSGVKTLCLLVSDSKVESVTVDMGVPVLEDESQFIE